MSKVTCRGWNRGSHAVDQVTAVADTKISLCPDCLMAYMIDAKTGQDARIKAGIEERPAPKKGDTGE